VIRNLLFRNSISAGAGRIILFPIILNAFDLKDLIYGLLDGSGGNRLDLAGSGLCLESTEVALLAAADCGISFLETRLAI